VEITGLRNPCVQIDRFQKGLMQAVLDRDAAGALVRKAGVMAVVIRGGDVRPGDVIVVTPPTGPHRPLQMV
jgi:MOSC domain-containing protein YiiM